MPRNQVLHHLITAFLLSAVISLAYVVVRNRSAQESIERDAALIRAQVETLENKKRLREQSLEYLKSRAFLEKEARLKYNLKKPGEKVVVIKKQDPSKSVLSDQSEKKNVWEKIKNFFERL